MKNSFWLNLLEGALTLAKMAIAQLIPEGTGRESLLITLQPSDKIVQALRDNDPDDGAQVLSIVKEHTNQQLVPFAQKEFLEEIIPKIKDERMRELVTLLSQVPFATAAIYTDDNSANATQMKTYLESWLEDPDNQKALLANIFDPLLNAVFKKNQFLADFISKTIRDQLQNVNIDINGDGK